MQRPYFLLPLLFLSTAVFAAAPETPGVFDRDSRRFHLFYDAQDAAPDEAFEVASERRGLLPVAGGSAAASQVLADWLANDQTCSMLMEPVFQDAAVGFAEVPEGRRFFWVLDLGVPSP